MTNNNYDVVIVGAGFSGLSAAWRLKMANENKSFIVLEARDRVGGRAWTEQYIDHETGKTCWIDMGAQWVANREPDQESLDPKSQEPQLQDAIHKLAKEMGINSKVDGAPRKGNILLIFKGHTYKIDIEKFGGKSKSPLFTITNFMKDKYYVDYKEFKDGEKKMDEMAKCFEAGTPWKITKNSNEDIKYTQEDINEWDSMTAYTWMDKNMKTDGAKFLFRIKCLLCFAVPPSEVSLLHMLHYIRCAGLGEGLNNAMNYRIEGGTQGIADAVYNRLKSHVRLNEPVREVLLPDPNFIEKGKYGITLIKTDKCTYSAKQVIMAIPPAIVSKIKFNPQLPARRLQFNQRMPMGSSIKCHLVYEKAFWEDKDVDEKDRLSGIVASDSHDVPFIVNNSVPQRKDEQNEQKNPDRPAVLGCFVDAKKGREWMNLTDEKIKEYVAKQVKEVFELELGEGTVPNPKKVYIANWGKEEWSGGCYAGIMPPGVWTGYKNTLREPVEGIIHWATSETSTKWFAYMDGAVRAGQKAAEQVLYNLNSNYQPNVHTNAIPIHENS